MDSLHYLPVPWFPISGFRLSKPQPWPTRIAYRRFVAVRTEVAAQEQLAALVEEARSARMRADKARARFMRLTESVEQMTLRAAAEIKAGNENAARQLIREKMRVMAALELSKKRAELLEEFSIKLNEVICLKETRLMASLSVEALSVDPETTTSGVRIVPPKEEMGSEEKVDGESERSIDDSKQHG